MNELVNHCKRITSRFPLDKKMILKDYFSWGRDSRHTVDKSEQQLLISSHSVSFRYRIKLLIISIAKKISLKTWVLYQINKKFISFDGTYRLMSDEYSKNLFAELIIMQIAKEDNFQLSSFTKDYVESYESASKAILESQDSLKVFNKWILKKISIKKPDVSIFTTPVFLNRVYQGKLYAYNHSDTLVEVEKGDIIIDAGIGWGDTTVFLAALAGSDGHSYAFDIMEEGLEALSAQVELNPELVSITPVRKALADQSGLIVNISGVASPGAKMEENNTGKQVETITIDDFVVQQNLPRVNFIKMDIEGAEVPALTGARETIKKFKPRLAICVYHKWDDLLVIPKLINSLRGDYAFYLDCSTGFGGEAVLFCK